MSGGRGDDRPRTLRGAIHVHSSMSYDGQHSIAELATFFRARGLDFIAVTEHSDGLDHDHLAELEAACRTASDRQFLMLPGIEFSCRRRLHILGIGVTEPIDSEDPLEVSRHIRAHGGISIVAHPLAYGTDHPDGIGAYVDGLEVWNITKDGWLGPGAGPLELWAAWRRSNRQLRGFGALDLHSFDSPAALTIEIEARGLATAAILEALRAGPLTIRGRFLRLSGTAPPRGAAGIAYRLTSRTYRALRGLRNRLVGRRRGSGRR